MFRTAGFIRACTMMACVLSLFSAIPAFAQETQSFHYVIPGFNSNEGSELIISNLSGRLATPEVTLVDSVQSQSVTIIIPFQAGGQGRLTPASFGLSAFDGTVVVKSSVPLSVTASLAGQAGFETIGPATSAGALIVPFSQGTAGAMKLTLFNDETTSTTVVINAVAADGSILEAVQRVIPTRGTHSEDVRGMFPYSGLVPRDISHLVIRTASNVFGRARAIYAQAEMFNFQDTAEGILIPTYDFAVVTGVPMSSAATNGVMPFFAQGSGYVTIVQIVNTSGGTGSVTLTARGPDGSPIPGTQPVVVSVPANGAIRRSVKNIFSLPGDLKIGSITFESNVAVVATEAIASESQGGFTLIPSGPGADTNFVFSIRDFNPSLFTGFTFYNPGASPARLTLRNMSDEGVAGSRTILTLNPSTSLTRTLAELLPEVRTRGFVHVASDVPVIVTSIEGAFDNSILGNMSAMHSQPDYVAPDPSTFMITGTIRHNGAPFPDVKVQLSGPVNVATTTDVNGVYFFENTPTGVYTIRPGVLGYTFDTAAKTLTVSSDSSRNNDFAATLSTPMITTVLPAAVVVGSPDTSVSVVVSPITPTTEIVFEGASVLTSVTTAGVPVTVSGGTAGTVTVVQNMQALKAMIPASNLEVAHMGSLLVRTYGPGGSVSSTTVPFAVGSPAPVLTSMSGVPDPLLIGNPGFTLTVNGTGFASTTVLQVGGVSLATTYVSSTQLRAFVGPQLLGQGGLLKVTALNVSPTVGPSNELTVSLFNPIPGVTSISPNTVEVRLDPNSLPLQLTVNGFGFSKDALVVVGSSEVPTEYRSSTQLIGSVPQKLLEKAEIVTVSVKNPPPTLGTSEAMPLSLYNLVPTVTSLDASPILFDPVPRFLDDDPSFPAQVVIRGTNFAKEGLIYVIGTPCDDKVGSLTGERISSTMIIGKLTIGCTGTYRMGVVNPQPGGGLSNLLSFNVAQYVAPAAVTVSGISPVAVVAGSNSFMLTITGSRFASGAVVNFGTAVLFPTSVTSNQVVVSIPSYLVRSSGILPVTVTNPDVTGSSNRILFTVN
jgi:hypothetical protein